MNYENISVLSNAGTPLFKPNTELSSHPVSSQYVSVSLDPQPALFVAPWVTDQFVLTFCLFVCLIQDLNPHIAIDYGIF